MDREDAERWVNALKEDFKGLEHSRPILPLNVSVHQKLLDDAYEDIETAFLLEFTKMNLTAVDIKESKSESDTAFIKSFAQAVENNNEKEGCIT